jgi:DNA-binding FadR family transcriptional regulator
MNITTLQRPAPLVEGVCQQLAELIRGGSADEERWLPAERSLAEKLGVSRTVVREATKRLEQQGMLEIQHGNGIKVVDRLHRPLNDSLTLLIPDMADRLQQLTETRLSIEPDAAAFAAQRATKEQIRTLPTTPQPSRLTSLHITPSPTRAET